MEIVHEIGGFRRESKLPMAHPHPEKTWERPKINRLSPCEGFLKYGGTPTKLSSIYGWILMGFSMKYIIDLEVPEVDLHPADIFQ